MINHQNPDSSPLYSIGRSDGRCVQRAGTYSAQGNDLRLQGIPCSEQIIPIIHPSQELKKTLELSLSFRTRKMLAAIARIPKDPDHCYQRGLVSTFIVARVQPKMSKGITDLLLLDASFFFFPDIHISKLGLGSCEYPERLKMCPFKK